MPSTPASGSRHLRTLRGAPPRGARAGGLAALALLAVGSASPGAEPPVPPALDAAASEREAEYRVKAAFLYHFVQYTSWPKDAFGDASSPIVLLVVGPDPFDQILDAALEGKRVGGRRIVVRRLAEPPAELDAHVAFTAGDARTRRELLERAGRRPVLLVGDEEGFASAGGQAGFFLAKDKVRFEVNVAAVERARLTISSELLKLARIVGEGRGGRT